ncbi:MAG: lipid-binding SYLF domain-containing protein [Woeseiaceae bacterium]|nr:lipid-binding SYLF domain-containing protein [Woeseiaceae bacterium]
MIKTVVIVLLLSCAGIASAEWQADPANKKQVASANAIAQIKERLPRSQPFFDEAYGMAVYPAVTRLGFGFGGATGKGFVIESDTIIGTSRFSQFTSGIQAGVRNFSMVVLFKDKDALDAFTKGKLQFLGQAGLAAGTKGIAGTPAFNDGVAIFTVTRWGLMGEFTVSGAKFSYRPMPGSKVEE